MKKNYRPISLDKVQTYSINSRNSKVNVSDHFAGEPAAGKSFHDFYSSLPDVLGVKDLRTIVSAIVNAFHNQRPVVLAMGGHVIKCGLQPVLKKLIENGIVTAVAMNGSAAIHDYEIALIGATSEDVGTSLHLGDFGFSEETGGGMNDALRSGHERGLGFGESVGRAIVDNKFPYAEHSLLASCIDNGIPATVHVAIGTDIIHQHPQADGAIIGQLSMQDFRTLTSVVTDLGDGGVWLNVGSAVIMPEVFLKALSIAQNLGHKVEDFTTANFDMIQHYRPRENVVKRPTSDSGQGYAISGHHEINIPLLAYAVFDELEIRKEP